MLLADEPNIREVITFPMNQQAIDLMMDAPTELPTEKLRELSHCAPPAAAQEGLFFPTRASRALISARDARGPEEPERLADFPSGDSASPCRCRVPLPDFGEYRHSTGSPRRKR